VEFFSLRASDSDRGSFHRVHRVRTVCRDPKGDPGATNVRVRKAAGFDRATVKCQPGERATGGGAHSVNGFIWAGAPAGNPSVIDTVAPLAFQGYTPTSWTAAADGGGPPWHSGGRHCLGRLRGAVKAGRLSLSGGWGGSQPP
jgi:hypothetical protein